MNANTVVGIYVFDDVELLDFAGPYEVFTTASRMAARRGVAHAIDVVSIAREAQVVTSRAGQRLLVQHTLDDHPPLDVLIVPGGVVDGERGRADLQAWIARQAQEVDILVSVCTGAFLLAEAGQLRGLRVTTHWDDIDDLARTFPELEVVRDTRWVDNGRVVTSAGISAGIDMSLHLVERLLGRDLACTTARQMDYEWNEGQPAQALA